MPAQPWYARRYVRVSITIAASILVMVLSVRSRDSARADAIAIATRAAREHGYDDTDTVIGCVLSWDGIYSIGFRQRVSSFGGGCVVKVRASDGRVLGVELTQ
jgi:hypothetical protein